MKLIKNRIILFWFLLVSLLFSQEKFPPRLKFEDILRGANSHPLIKISKIDNNVIGFKNGLMGTEFINLINNIKDDSLIYPDLIIYIPSIDTMHFSHKIRVFKELADISIDFPLIFNNTKNYVIDFDKNGYTDILFQHHIQSNITSRIYEFNKNELTFNLKYVYPEEFHPPYKIIDIDNDGLIEVIGYANEGRFIFYKQPNRFLLPILKQSLFREINSYFAYYPSEVLDIDNDSIPELIFFVSSSKDTIDNYSLFITKYNPIIQQFNFANKIKLNTDFLYGICIGDFDNNGKVNILLNEMFDKFCIYEQKHQGSIEFTLKLKDSVSLPNISCFNFSSDIDNNGIPEIWISSFDVWYYKTYLYGYEINSQGNLFRKYWIEILGDIPLLARCLLPLDIDKDGNEEILFLTDYVFYIFKYTQEHGWILDYFKINDEWRQYRIFTNLIVGDIDFDGYEEIFIGTMNSPFDPITRPFKIITKIYKFNFTSASLEQNTINRDFLLYPNYPNPFNSQTTITFTIPIEENVEILINNILGEEVRTISLGLLNAGKHTINWDGKNNLNQDLPSGIYLINLKTSKYSKTIKSMLIR